MSLFKKLFVATSQETPKTPEHIVQHKQVQTTVPQQTFTLDLSKKESLNLSKNTTLDLSKAKSILDNVRLAAGWDPAVKGQNIDLDLFAILLDDKGHFIDTIYFRHLRAQGIYLDGDNLTGEGDGDDENIHIQLNRLSPLVHRILIGVHSYRGHTFDNVKNAYVRLVTNRELARFTLSEDGKGMTAVKFAEFRKNNNEWSFVTLGELGQYKSIKDVVKEYQR